MPAYSATRSRKIKLIKMEPLRCLRYHDSLISTQICFSYVLSECLHISLLLQADAASAHRREAADQYAPLGYCSLLSAEEKRHRRRENKPYASCYVNRWVARAIWIRNAGGREKIDELFYWNIARSVKVTCSLATCFEERKFEVRFWLKRWNLFVSYEITCFKQGWMKPFGNAL